MHTGRPNHISTTQDGPLLINQDDRPALSTKEPGLEVTDITTIQAADDNAAPAFSIKGWRGGALCAAACALLSLTVNIGVTGWLFRKGAHARNAQIELFKGDCGTVHDLNLWTHLGINALSTLLLAGSNYCMQCLAAPTRADIDRAHQTGRWLEIGVPSLRNLPSVAWSKRLLWVMLALTSLPIHLMYNSAFYSSVGVTDYSILFVTPGFLEGARANVTRIPLYTGDTELAPLQAQAPSWERLGNAACIQAYSVGLPTERRHVAVVSSNTTGNGSLLDSRFYHWYTQVLSYSGANNFNPYGWICSDEDSCYTRVADVEAKASTWAPYGWQAEYCMSEPFPGQCTFKANIPIMLVIVCCNLVKMALMLLVAFRLRGRPLITIGDAIESFLNRPDTTTIELPLLSKQEVIKGNKWPRKTGSSATITQTAPVSARRWSSSVSRPRWTCTMVSVVVALLLVVAFLIMALCTVTRASRASPWTLGFGSVNVESLIVGWSLSKIPDQNLKILSLILVANLPQLVLSVVYFSVNALLTTMFLAREWNNFAFQRKTLRVSNPRGAQRSTHFLQLPYKVAMPMMALSGILHWLVSQSIFLALIDKYNVGYGPTAGYIATCGFSPMPMIIVIIIGVCMVVAVVVLSRLRYKGTMPVAGSCSAAISAACHPPENDENASVKAVQWGLVSGEHDGAPTRYTFTSCEVVRSSVATA